MAYCLAMLCAPRHDMPPLFGAMHPLILFAPEKQVSRSQSSDSLLMKTLIFSRYCSRPMPHRRCWCNDSVVTNEASVHGSAHLIPYSSGQNFHQPHHDSIIHP